MDKEFSVDACLARQREVVIGVRRARVVGNLPHPSVAEITPRMRREYARRMSGKDKATERKVLDDRLHCGFEFPSHAEWEGGLHRLGAAINRLVESADLNRAALLTLESSLRIVLCAWLITDPETNRFEPRLTVIQDLSTEECSHELIHMCSDTLLSERLVELCKAAWVVVQSERSPDPTVALASADPSHSADFTSVNWFGEKYTFAKGNQANTVKLLWHEWESGRGCLGQEAIGKKVGFEGLGFRLSHVFRTRTAQNKLMPHPAWGTMIVPMGKGVYGLCAPTGSTNPTS